MYSKGYQYFATLEDCALKKSIIIIATFIAATIIGGLILYTNIFPLAEPIELPKANEVYAVEVKKENVIANYTDDKAILAILNYFSNAKPTRVMSINDTPDVGEFYIINFLSKDESLYKSYIYYKNSKWYIEQPYYGVYEVGEEILDFLP